MIVAPDQIQQHTFPFTNNFNVKEGLCGFRSYFYIQNSGGHELGTAVRPLMRMSDTYNLTDAEERPIAKGRVNPLSLRTTIEFSTNNEPIATVTKKICSFYRGYTIFNNQEDPIAKVQGNFFNTHFTISDPQTKAIMAIFTRPFISCGMKWKVEIKPENRVDTRILSMLPMFITSQINSEAETSKND